MVEVTLLTAPLWVVVFVGGGLALLMLRFRGRRGAYPLLGVFVGSVLWAGGYAVELTTPSALAHVVRFTGTTVVPLSIFVLALQLTGRERFVTVRHVGAVAALPLVTYLLTVTNGMHGLWADPATVTNASVAGSTIAWGPVFYLSSVYLLGVAAAAAGLFLQQAVREHGAVLITRATTFVVATAIPVVSYASYLVGATAIDPSPFTLVVSGFLLMAAMFYF